MDIFLTPNKFNGKGKIDVTLVKQSTSFSNPNTSYTKLCPEQSHSASQVYCPKNGQKVGQKMCTKKWTKIWK